MLFLNEKCECKFDSFRFQMPFQTLGNRSPTKLLKTWNLCLTDPSFIYATRDSIIKLEFREGGSSETHLFATNDGILSFDLAWNTDWLYWANLTGHIQRTSLTQVKTEVVPTPVPGKYFDSCFAALIFF